MTIENREQASRMTMRTPCCGASYFIHYEYVGRPYMSEQVVDSFECAADGCDNVWFADGTPSMIRSTVPDDSGCRQVFWFDEGWR
ncbi:hypothetical protein BH708_03115 [Brachybacterium sp. P6-10-X1]|uniref:hypothetical protein n=1 Tax=Brachybacterium sp. P6-10-X1 TaxID=1903186 RepID=UPI000971A239|nr:hypothetical protein [Brachybacterium sp. P6-10-X1]APX31879.1 hypothetical protein BH708_03115 [Brachybacterium sp. P6-10-X1]